MGTEAAMRIILTGEIVGKGACSELCRRAGGSRGTALLAGQARGRGAVGAFTAMQYLGKVAWKTSARRPKRDGMESLLPHKMLEA
jgi:hypothetical protein